ncbi:hypothetical protein [Paenibacillus sp. 32O-W]|uniref:hypothetical protein n=1 Tax=Paenibacillus sp. 32O-W TaxID=1695218 RepID=UPI001C9318B7|nr:hypothetical protein [Paenibacillus sp. 32O-W]
MGLLLYFNVRVRLYTIQGIAIHELGHGLGLAHESERTFLVMVPSVLFSDGTFARYQYFPGIGDENSVNKIYESNFSLIENSLNENDFIESTWSN